jgi:uncharacterized membrane protein
MLLSQFTGSLLALRPGYSLYEDWVIWLLVLYLFMGAF